MLQVWHAERKHREAPGTFTGAVTATRCTTNLTTAKILGLRVQAEREQPARVGVFATIRLNHQTVKQIAYAGGLAATPD